MILQLHNVDKSSNHSTTATDCGCTIAFLTDDPVQSVIVMFSILKLGIVLFSNIHPAFEKSDRSSYTIKESEADFSFALKEYETKAFAAICESHNIVVVLVLKSGKILI